MTTNKPCLHLKLLSKMYFLFCALAFYDVIKFFTDCRVQPTPIRNKTILIIRERNTLLRHQHNHD